MQTGDGACSCPRSSLVMYEGVAVSSRRLAIYRAGLLRKCQVCAAAGHQASIQCVTGLYTDLTRKHSGKWSPHRSVSLSTRNTVQLTAALYPFYWCANHSRRHPLHYTFSIVLH